MSYLSVSTREVRDDTAVVYVEGYLNSLLGEEVERVIREVLDAGRQRVVLHFGGTRLINSIGVSFILGIVERMRERKGTLAFCALSRVNREIFQVTGVSRYVSAFDSEEEALAFFGQTV